MFMIRITLFATTASLVSGAGVSGWTYVDTPSTCAGEIMSDQHNSFVTWSCCLQVPPEVLVVLNIGEKSLERLRVALNFGKLPSILVR